MADGLFGTNTPAPRQQTTKIAPAGISGSTYVRPQQMERGSNLRALADSLGSLNSSLNAYAQVKDQIEDDPNSRANKEWIAKRQQMSLGELVEDAETGQHGGVRVRQDAVEALLGERANVDFRAEVMRDYELEFDKENGNFDEWFEGKRQKFAEALPSEVARGNFFKQTDGFKGTVLEANVQTRVTTAKQKIGATIVDSWYTKIGDMVGTEGSADPDQIAEAILSSADSNRAFLDMSGEERNATVWALAERMAMDGNPDLAKAILFTKRDGLSLADLPAYATKAHQLIETGNGIRDKADNEASLDTRLAVSRSVALGTFTAEDAKALEGTPYYTPQGLAGMVESSTANREQIARNAATEEQKRLLRKQNAEAKNGILTSAIAATGEVGGVFKLKDVEIPNVSGTGTDKISRADQIEMARTHMEDQWSAQEKALIEKEGMDPAAARKSMDDVRLAWYAGNGLTNERWKGQITALPVMATPETFKDNPKAAAKFIETAEHWRTMNAQNPAYADSMLDAKSREFLDLYDLGRTAHDMTEEDALSYASGWASRPEMEKHRYRIKPNEADEIVRGVLYDMDVDSYEGHSFSVINQKVQTWAAQGLSSSQIETNVKKWAANSTYTVNGVVMTAERAVPPDFPDVADRFLDKVFAERGEAMGIDDAEDFYLQPVSGESKWQVWSKSMGVPIGRVYLDDAAMQTERDTVAAERDAMLREAHAIKAGGDKVKREMMEPLWREYRAKEQARINAMRLPQKSWLNGYNPPNNKAADAAQEELDRYMDTLGMRELNTENRPPDVPQYSPDLMPQ